MNRNQRYEKHYNLKDFGTEGQQRLHNASVLVVGAGGLGCPALQYLTRAGVGRIGIVDNDCVDMSNLNRQTLYNSDDIGVYKSREAARKLNRVNTDIVVLDYIERLDTKNALDIVRKYDIVLDCTDNFPTRYLLSDLCAILNKPLIFAAIHSYEGHISVFNRQNANKESFTYRHLFPFPPSVEDSLDCNELGVLGILPGILGTMQAAEAIKIITGIGEVLSGTLLTYNMLDNQLMKLQIPVKCHPDSHAPRTLEEFQQFDYHTFCQPASCGGVVEISALEFDPRLQDQHTLILDVRQKGEWPLLPFKHINIPLNYLEERLGELDLAEKKRVVVLCQSGRRSLKAAAFLFKKLPMSIKVCHLVDGIQSLDIFSYD